MIAVIDASAMGQTAGALAHGLRDYGPVNLAGVIANRVAGAGHAAMVAASLRGLPLLGSLAQQPGSLPERHLGLLPPDEIVGLDAMLDQLAEQLSLDTAAWAAIEAAPSASAEPPPPVAPPLAGKIVAIARDAAFAFLHPANLDCLRELGATLCFFSPLRNAPVPDHADAIYLPGGYPELHGPALAAASDWQASLRRAHADGKPIWAECGGMMAVAERWSNSPALPGPWPACCPERCSCRQGWLRSARRGWRLPMGCCAAIPFTIPGWTRLRLLQRAPSGILPATPASRSTGLAHWPRPISMRTFHPAQRRRPRCLAGQPRWM